MDGRPATSPRPPPAGRPPPPRAESSEFSSGHAWRGLPRVMRRICFPVTGSECGRRRSSSAVRGSAGPSRTGRPCGPGPCPRRPLARNRTRRRGSRPAPGRVSSVITRLAGSHRLGGDDAIRRASRATNASRSRLSGPRLIQPYRSAPRVESVRPRIASIARHRPTARPRCCTPRRPGRDRRSSSTAPDGVSSRGRTHVTRSAQFAARPRPSADLCYRHDRRSLRPLCTPFPGMHRPARPPGRLGGYSATWSGSTCGRSTLSGSPAPITRGVLAEIPARPIRVTVTN